MTKEEGDLLMNCRLGNNEAVSELLMRGVDSNCRDVRGFTPISRAMDRMRFDPQSEETLRLLIDHGVDTTGYEHTGVIRKLKGIPGVAHQSSPAGKEMQQLLRQLLSLTPSQPAFSFSGIDLLSQGIPEDIPIAPEASLYLTHCIPVYEHETGHQCLYLFDYDLLWLHEMVNEQNRVFREASCSLAPLGFVRLGGSNGANLAIDVRTGCFHAVEHVTPYPRGGEIVIWKEQKQVFPMNYENVLETTYRLGTLEEMAAQHSRG